MDKRQDIIRPRLRQKSQSQSFIRSRKMITQTKAMVPLNPNLSYTAPKTNIVQLRRQKTQAALAETKKLEPKKLILPQPHNTLKSISTPSSQKSTTSTFTRQPTSLFRQTITEVDLATYDDPLLKGRRGTLSQMSLEKRALIKEVLLAERDWPTRIRRDIKSCFTELINISNGMELDKGRVTGAYRYYLGYGNNSTLIPRILKSRWWWLPVKDETQLEAANFWWTSWRCYDFMNIQPCRTGKSPAWGLASHSDKVVEDLDFLGQCSQFTKCQFSQQHIGIGSILDSQSYVHLNQKDMYFPKNIKVWNRLENNHHLANKRSLYRNLKAYYEAMGKNTFQYIPLTFHIKNGTNDIEYYRFLDHFLTAGLIWIVKPGEETNQGVDIEVVSSLDKIKELISKCNEKKNRTYIIQKYIEKPLLIHKRKFDIRCYAMFTSFNGIGQGYFYKDGYLRTTCQEYSTKNIHNRFVHLTNDAVQKHADDYSRFELGNKMSYLDFQKYINNQMPVGKKINFFEEILPQIRKMIKDTFKATYLKLNSNKRLHQFEIFGYDILIDESWHPWLIEVNTNPWLELASPYLARLIPEMLENAFKLTIDVLYPEPENRKRRAVSQFMTQQIPENKFELIFHSRRDGGKLKRILGPKFNALKEEHDEDPKFLNKNT